MMLKARVIALAAAILPLACGPATSPPVTNAQAMSHGAAVKKLALRGTRVWWDVSLLRTARLPYAAKRAWTCRWHGRR